MIFSNAHTLLTRQLQLFVDAHPQEKDGNESLRAQCCFIIHNLLQQIPKVWNLQFIQNAEQRRPAAV